MEGPGVSQRQRVARALIVACVLLGVAGALAFLVRSNWAHHKAILGPTRIAATNDGGWWVASHHHLHRFDNAGQRVLKVSLDDLGINDPTAGLGVLADGRVLLSQPKTPRLLICDSRAANCSRLQLRRDQTEVEPEHVSLLQGIDTERFALSDRDGGRLMLAHSSGRILAERAMGAPADGYRVPYQPRLSTDGELLIPNRADRKIARLHTESLAEASAAFSASGAPGARGERLLPVDVARGADGRWWVLNARDCICDADLIELDASAKPVRRVALAGIEDPRSIAIIGSRLLIADQDGARLDTYDTTSGRVVESSDPAFLAELQQVRELRSRGNRNQGTVICALIGIPLLGVILLLMAGERLSTGIPVRPTARPAPLGPGISWIGLNLEYMKSLRQVMTITVALIVVAFVAATALILNALSDRGAVPLVCMVLFLIAFGTAAVMSINRLLRQRIGTDGEFIHYDAGNGVCEKVPLSEVLTDGQTLLIRKFDVRLYDGLRDRFDRSEAASLILARLPEKCFVNRWQLMRATIQRQPLLWGTVAAAVVMMLVLEIVR
jgi:hypothetical protein